MSVCKFYLSGSCRYGDKCWNIHPEDNSSRFFSKGEYYVSTNQRSLWKPSSPPITQKNYNSSGVAFSFNNALSSSNRNIGTKKGSLFSVNKFNALSDDEDMEQINEGSSRYSSNAPRNFNHQHNSGFSLSHLTKTTVAPQHVGLFRPKGGNSTPDLVTSQTGAVAPQHIGLFKPKFGSDNSSPVSSQTSVVAPQHVGLFKPKSASDKLALTSQKPVQFSFSPNQFKVINNPSTVKEQQNLFKQASFSQSITASPKTLFGKPVEGQSTSYSEPISRSSIPKSVLSESLWLDELGSDTYTKLDELLPYERDCFNANIFELHNVPLRPPPKELCF